MYGRSEQTDSVRMLVALLKWVYSTFGSGFTALCNTKDHSSEKIKHLKLVFLLSC